MTPEELRYRMLMLGLSEAGLARLLRLGHQNNPRQSARTVRRWKSGENPIPGPVVVILEAYADHGGQLPDL